MTALPGQAMETQSLRVLGIDPGMACMGYGLVDGYGEDLALVGYGTIETPAGLSAAERLSILYQGLCDVIRRFQPSEVAVELFIGRNLRSALAVGQARGVALLAAAQGGLPVWEYTPQEMKRWVAGYGRGSKEQVQEMVRLQLELSAVPEPDDAADALGLAICHIRQARLRGLRSAKEGESS